MKKIIFPILTLIVFGCQNSTSTKASDTTHADSVKTNADAKDNIAILKSFYEKTAEKMDTVAYAGFFANNFTEYGDGTDRDQAEGMWVAAMTRELNEKLIPTARGGRWQQVQLARVIKRLGAADAAGSEV